jgi:ribosome-dependent ATPase
VEEGEGGASESEVAPEVAPGPAPGRRRVSLRRLLAYSLREGTELLRDPIRLAFALAGTVLLMLVFGYGITFDVEDLTYAASTATARRKAAPTSKASPAPAISTSGRRSSATPTWTGACSAANHPRHRDPPGFARDLLRGEQPTVAAWIDGSMPFRAETVRGYLEGLHAGYVTGTLARDWVSRPNGRLAEIASRYRYNQSFESVNAMVPTVIALLLVFIPGDADGARRGAGEGARLHHQPLRHAGEPPGVPARQAAALRRRRHGELPGDDAAGGHAFRRRR